MRESASTDLREPQGSNPLGPPGPELLGPSSTESETSPLFEHGLGAGIIAAILSAREGDAVSCFRGESALGRVRFGEELRAAADCLANQADLRAEPEAGPARQNVTPERRAVQTGQRIVQLARR